MTFRGAYISTLFCLHLTLVMSDECFDCSSQYAAFGEVCSSVLWEASSLQMQMMLRRNPRTKEVVISVK